MKVYRVKATKYRKVMDSEYTIGIYKTVESAKAAKQQFLEECPDECNHVVEVYEQELEE